MEHSLLVKLNGCGWDGAEGDNRAEAYDHLQQAIAELVRKFEKTHRHGYKINPFLGACKTVTISKLELTDHIHYRETSPMLVSNLTLKSAVRPLD